jgi:hypothetical protein
MSEYDPELVERMVALVRKIAEEADRFQIETGSLDSDFLLAEGSALAARESRTIVAMLPEPVDPDLIEAREFIVRFNGPHAEVGYTKSVREGRLDDNEDLQLFLAAIKRGRELQALEDKA